MDDEQFPYRIEIFYSDVHIRGNEIRNYISEELKIKIYDWHWHPGGGEQYQNAELWTYLFRYEDDAMAFKLRWI